MFPLLYVNSNHKWSKWERSKRSRRTGTQQEFTKGQPRRNSGQFYIGMLFDHTLYLYKSDARKIKASVVKPTNLMLIVAGVCVATLHSSKSQAPAFSTAVHCVILLGRDTGRLF